MDFKNRVLYWKQIFLQQVGLINGSKWEEVTKGSLDGQGKYVPGTKRAHPVLFP